VFVVAPGQSFMYPGEAANRVSRVLHEIGDSSGVLVSDE
jgi:hypothetical protein